MPDKCSKETRSHMMSSIKNKNTNPELLIRKELFLNGFRYRLHNGKLPGKPDLVLKKYSAVVLINGCFWHGHNCIYFKWPKSNHDFWYNKINGNIQNDTIVKEKLQDMGYRICVFWECVTRNDKLFHKSIYRLIKWLYGNRRTLEISL